MRAVENLQLDPLNITARSQDLMLHARVAGYQPEGWQALAYGERRFFDWGGWLAVRPMEELPYFRSYMREAARHPELVSWAETHAGVLDEMRAVLRERGPVSNRDFETKERARVSSYLVREAPRDEAERFMVLKAVAFHGLHDGSRCFPMPGPTKVGPTRQRLAELVADGLVSEVTVEGQRGTHYLLTRELPLLDELMRG